MTATDLRRTLALESALNEVKATAQAVADCVVQNLNAQSTVALRLVERDALLGASHNLQRKIHFFQASFCDKLQEQVSKEITPAQEPFGKSVLGASDWQSLTLVDEVQVDQEVFANRLSQEISHACEVELRDLAPYMGSLLDLGRADESCNPLRPQNIAKALFQAISEVTEDDEMRKVLARELGRSMAIAMKEGYKHIREDLQGRGVKALSFSVKGADTSNSQFGSQSTRSPPPGEAHDSQNGPDSGGFKYSTSGRPSGPSSRSGLGPSIGAAHPRSAHSATPRNHGSSRRATSSSADQAADVQLMALLRKLTALVSQPAPFDELSASTGADLGFGHRSVPITGSDHGDGLTGMMAVNLIRTHREELVKASTGKLDHMVIDVIGSLFDQILSDPKVPPQMARQIARLQLPVLRVALSDNTFFSSRKHPVRRFVNRIASLACAFDNFDQGPGLLLVNRIRDLIQEIVDGDFDQVELYSLKLTELEAFVVVQPETQSDTPSPAKLLANKESELRMQQRYMMQLQSALKPIDIPAFLRDFLSQVWSQALVCAYRQAGPDAGLTQTMRSAGRDLAMSVQPKGSPALRHKFLRQLPGLMKDLKDGMMLIGWPEAAHEAFFAELLPAHAQSLKENPISELDYNLLYSQVEAIFNAAIPGLESSWRGESLPPITDNEVERRFTPEEAISVGLVNESTVDWSAGPVDIDLTAPSEVSAAHEGTEPAAQESDPDETTPGKITLGVDIELDLNLSEPPSPTRGAELANHIQIGFAYQMFLQNQWKKVRLSFVSPGRTFFVFTHGDRHCETTSLTARMLTRMCESGRLRAVETAFLLERATARARKQLAELASSRRD